MWTANIKYDIRSTYHTTGEESETAQEQKQPDVTLDNIWVTEKKLKGMLNIFFLSLAATVF